MSHYELQVDVKRRLKAMLENEKLIPRVRPRFFESTLETSER